MEDQGIKEVEIHNSETSLASPVLENVLKGYKEVTLSKHGQVRLYKPGIHVVEAGDRVVSSKKLEMMRQKEQVLPLERELRKQYEERGVWSYEEDERLADYRDKIIRMVNEIKAPFDDNFLALSGKWIDDADEEAWTAYHALAALPVLVDGGEPLLNYVSVRDSRYRSAQSKYKELRDQYNSLFSGTVENFANYERELFYCTKCYKREDGTFLWSSVEELREDEDSFIEAVSEANRYWNGMDAAEMKPFFDALLAV